MNLTPPKRAGRKCRDCKQVVDGRHLCNGCAAVRTWAIEELNERMKGQSVENQTRAFADLQKIIRRNPAELKRKYDLVMAAADPAMIADILEKDFSE